MLLGAVLDGVSQKEGRWVRKRKMDAFIQIEWVESQEISGD